MQSESPRNVRAAGPPASLAALRREAAALQDRAAQLTAASAQIERRLAELVGRRASSHSRGADAARIAELRGLGRESVRLLQTAVQRRETLRRRIELLERSQPSVPAPPPTAAPTAPHTVPAEPAPPLDPEPDPALPTVVAAPDALPSVPASSVSLPPAPALPAAVPAHPSPYPPIRRQRLERLGERRAWLPASLAALLRYAAMAILGGLLVVLSLLITPLPELFGWQVYAVQTGSMAPAIPVGSLIAVQPVPAAALQVGDVITFSERARPDIRVTHRIVSLETKDGQRLAVTKGDANNTTDSWNVPVSDAIGRVAFHVPAMGYVLAWLGSTTVKLAALALAGLMLSLPSLRRRNRRPEHDATGAVVPASPSPTRKTEPAPPAMVPAAPVATATVTPTAPAAVALSVSSARAQAEQVGPIDTVGDELPDEPDASFDVLANEIDALLGRIASRETADGRGARARAR